MPSSRRHAILRKLEYVEKDVLNALVLLDDIYQIYFPNYPDYYEKVDVARKLLREVINFISLFRDIV